MFSTEILSQFDLVEMVGSFVMVRSANLKINFKQIINKNLNKNSYPDDFAAFAIVLFVALTAFFFVPMMSY
jgi:hypothetical protein